MLTSSGQAANFYAVFNIATNGDHVVASASIYGGTYNLFAVTMKKMGIEFTFVSPDCTEEELGVNEINSGMYVFNSEALNFSLDKLTNNNAQGEYYLTDTVSIIKSTGLKVDAMPIDDINEILGVNTKAQLAEAEAIMSSRINLDNIDKTA